MGGYGNGYSTPANLTRLTDWPCRRLHRITPPNTLSLHNFPTKNIPITRSRKTASHAATAIATSILTRSFSNLAHDSRVRNPGVIQKSFVGGTPNHQPIPNKRRYKPRLPYKLHRHPKKGGGFDGGFSGNWGCQLLRLHVSCFAED